MKKELHEIWDVCIASTRQKANAMFRKRSFIRRMFVLAVIVLFLITKKILNSMAREQISRNVFIAIDSHVDTCLATSDRREQNTKFRAFSNSLGLRPIKMTPYTAVLLYTGNAKPVVIKRVIFREDSPSQEDAISRVVQHKNIMRTYKTFRSSFVNRKNERQTIIWLISEYLSLRLSHRYVNRNEEIIRRIVRDVLQALEYLHRMNIAHLDIKIENIMGKETDGAVRFKLIDLGYGRMLDNDVGGREMSETYIPTKSYGTFPYKPPEVVRENIHGLKSDIYCLGAVAWFLSLGRTPFYTDGERDLQAFRRFLAGGVRVRFREDTSPALQDFVIQCMHPSARERPSAFQLLNHHFVTREPHVRQFSDTQ
uniref:Calmodulin-dependent protein kinase n=1 Tax=Antonospora locustae TaxID=278021 RepID=Q95VS3_ANTLO|nr:calmodulin-dependent protein kinase [Antonospora locustae]|eukprot:jgi/Antlo1/1658/2179